MTDLDDLGPRLMFAFALLLLAVALLLVFTASPMPQTDPSYDPSTATPYRGET